MKSCNTIDCTLDSINYLTATLDGCSFGRVTASDVRNLDTATITQGGAVLECGAVEVCVLRQTIDVHLVKIGLPEKLRRKACLGRFVKQLLIDDFQGTTNAIIKSPEPIRLAAALLRCPCHFRRLT